MAEAPASSASRAEWDEYARSQGLNPDDYGSKSELQEALGASSSGDGDDSDPSGEARSAAKGEGPDRAPSEVFNGPAHALNLGVGQSAFVNDQKKRELEAAFGDRYEFAEIQHHGTLNPIEGDHVIAWEVRNAGDAEAQQPAESAGVAPPSDDLVLNPEQEPEGLKANA